jgi:hypothetical protein
MELAAASDEHRERAAVERTSRVEQPRAADARLHGREDRGVAGAGVDVAEGRLAQLGQGWALARAAVAPVPAEVQGPEGRQRFRPPEGRGVRDALGRQVGDDLGSRQIPVRGGFDVEEHPGGVREGGRREAVGGEQAPLGEPADGAAEGGDGAVVGGAAGGGEQGADLGGAGERGIHGGAMVDEQLRGVSDPGAVGETADPLRGGQDVLVIISAPARSSIRG